MFSNIGTTPGNKNLNRHRYNQYNQALLSGVIEAEFEYSHGKFYRSRLGVLRLSGVEDHIPIIISENLMMANGFEENATGKFVVVEGEFNSFPKIGADGRKHSDFFIFVNAICKPCLDEQGVNQNYIQLEGRICKPTFYRVTPFGREITELIIAVERNYVREDYIPCIAWGQTAWDARFLNVGDTVRLNGRIQSREYLKKISEQALERRTTYEVSIRRLIVIG